MFRRWTTRTMKKLRGPLLAVVLGGISLALLTPAREGRATCWDHKELGSRPYNVCPTTPGLRCDTSWGDEACTIAMYWWWDETSPTGYQFRWACYGIGGTCGWWPNEWPFWN